jgi:hypothetical protein
LISDDDEARTYGGSCDIDEDDLGDGDNPYVTTTGGTGDDGSFGYDE